MRIYASLLFILIASLSFGQVSQEIIFENGPELLTMGDVFSIKIYIRNNSKSDVKSFPEIDGFRMEGKSVSHANVQIGGKSVLQHIVTQNYRALSWGTFDVPEFEFEINGDTFLMPSEEITVSNAGVDESYIDTLDNEDALLFLFVDKREIVVGESFRINLAFYVSEDNTASWEFPRNLSYQVNQLSNQLKPINSLESRRDITNIQAEPAVINGKKYIRYKLFESIYYPLNSEDITLPSVRFNMDKVNTASDSSTSVEVRPFYSKPFTVTVSELPEHPLKNRVAVGDFRLTELSKIGTAQTGKILNYSLKLSGNGYVNTLLFERPENNSKFDFYPPQSSEKQIDGYERGEKTFTFKVFPKDSGIYNFGDYFQWIYYNANTDSYDTLRPSQEVIVTGPKVETSSASSRGIYDNIAELSISEKSIDYRNIVKKTVNILLFLMLVGMLFIFEFKRKR